MSTRDAGREFRCIAQGENAGFGREEAPQAGSLRHQTGAVRRARGERGAALIIALGMLTLLLVIAVTFFRASRDDVRTADNAVNAVRAEMMADGATAVAIAFINHDHNLHPTLTSLDHAWRTYFNGSWMAAKPETWAEIFDPSVNTVQRVSPLRKGIPLVDPLVADSPLFLHDDIYIPRLVTDLSQSPVLDAFVPAAGYQTYQTSATPPYLPSDLKNPFVTTIDVADPADLGKFPPLERLAVALGSNPADFVAMESRVYDELAADAGLPFRVVSLLDYGGNPPPANTINRTLPAEQIHFWTDVDNNGDGLRDSMWLPVPADRYFPEDGLDNDLDGTCDAAGCDIDGDGVIDLPPDLDGEPGIFLYRGDTDGLDNDGDGVVDENDIETDRNEYNTVIFTTAAPFWVVDPNTGELVNLRQTNFAFLSSFFPSMGIRPTDNVLFEDPADVAIGQINASTGQTFPIFARDNDYDLVINDVEDASQYMLTEAAVTALIAGDTSYPYYDLLLAVVGIDRLNEYAFEYGLSPAAPFGPAGARGPLFPSGQIRGETVTEIVGRMAILITDESSKVNLNSAGGLNYQSFPNDVQYPMSRAFNRGVGANEFELRVLPGMGYAFSNRMWTYKTGGVGGNAFSVSPLPNPPYTGFLNPTLATDHFPYDVSLPGYGRVDDNANLLQLALNRIDDDGDDTAGNGVDEGVLASIGQDFEGIDEPLEFQRFRPYRNREAESDFDDNDLDLVEDEIGELADRFYRTHHELKLLDQFVNSFTNNFPDVENLVTVHSFDRNERHFHQDVALGTYRDLQNRRTVGLKKDLNVARPSDVADAVMREWSYPPSVLELREDRGVTVGDLDLTNPNPDPGDIVTAFLSGLRQENVTVFSDQAMLDVNPPADRAVTLLADPQLRARQVAVSLKDYADLDSTRSVDEFFVEDQWWQAMAAAVPGTPGADIARTRRIQYTSAGIEQIRINEVNVRPIRRVEAEATTNSNLGTYELGFDPNRFVPQSFSPAQIENEGFRMRTRTTFDVIEEYNDNNPSNPIVYTDSDDTANWALLDRTGLLGIGAAFRTYRSYLNLQDTASERDFEVPDVMQFSFQATDELPQGRYYLTANTQFVETDGTVQESIARADGMRFAVKIGTLENDWFADLANIEAYFRGNRVYTQAWRSPALIGSDRLGGSAGMVFMQGDAVFRDINPGAGPQSLTAEEFLQKYRQEPNIGFSIEVPPRDDLLAESDRLWVHVAIQSTQGDDGLLAINWFDFSQEPDHEWVEITNLSDDDVDLSGWSLAVENHPLGFGPMTIPFGTTIAGKGMLLLGTNKFDYAFNTDFQDPPLPIIPGDLSFFDDPDLFDRGSAIFTNGMGLATYALPASLETPPANMFPFLGITVPRSFYEFIDPANVNQGSVFEGFISDRTNIPIPAADFVDFVDRNGDGVVDNATQQGRDAIAISTPFSAVAGVELRSSPNQLDTGAAAENKPWDRIVELIVPDLVPQTPGVAFTAQDIGRIVLGGGIFPNRPEFDLSDNDDDNRILIRDGIDNDGDGQIDEVDEGIDEGQSTRDLRLRAEMGDPTAFFAAVPGSYHPEVARYLTAFFTFDPAFPAGIPGYWDPGSNPPQWKEFIERRNFPGDNVIVTLYEGPARNGQVADRVTYTQRDVDNRQIDDLILVTDLNQDGVENDGVALGDPGVPIPLNFNFLSLWPENTMGQDFARSLERKLPTYPGDRFGTSNRFQATDGNYDDWSDSTGRWEFDIQELADGRWSVILGLVDRFATTVNFYSEVAHAIGGTPLRENGPTRVALSPTISDTPVREMFELAEYPNHPLVSPGDALLMSHTSRRQRMSEFTDPFTFGRYLMDLTSPNSRGTNSDFDKMLLGQRFESDTAPINYFKDIRSFIGDLGTTDSVSLNVGQAEVIQVLRPDLSPPPLNDPWGVGAAGQAPQRWSPVLSYELADDGDPQSLVLSPTFDDYNYERVYLFNTPGPATLPATVTNDRAPLASRALVYASRNLDTFPTGDVVGARAMFVWDGDDGVENGEYDLYVVTTEDLTPLALADNGTGNLLTTFGSDFIGQTDRTPNREVFLSIEAFRDVDGDRRAWQGLGGYLAEGDLNQGQPNSGRPAESFGVIRNVQPDADGMIHYGVVRIENNFLAVLIENRSAPGRVARISRVILAARNKTPGRININTVESTRISLDAGPPDDDDLPHHFYNPLQGLPGVLLRPPDQDSVGPGTAAPPPPRQVDPVGTTLPTNLNGTHVQVLASQIVNQRQRLLGERPDGRYYELTPDLLDEQHYAFEDLGADELRPPLVRNEVLSDVNSDGIADLDADNRDEVLAEAAERFRRMQNLITTKADVYEILVLVQTGYGVDSNGDGRINWRDDNEFTVTGEKRSRTIYER